MRSGFFVVGLATRKVQGELKKAVILNRRPAGFSGSTDWVVSRCCHFRGFGEYILPSSSPKVSVGELSFRKRTTTAKTDSRLQHSGMTATATTVPRTLRAANFSEMRTKQYRFCRCCLAVYCKGVVSFFFFVKILINRGWCTRMYLLYKNVYKRPFCSNIKA